MLAIIGGSGLTRLSTLSVAHREVVRTPYGQPSSALLFGQIASRDTIFLARHGHGHTIPPHRVNYRANMWALKQRGGYRDQSYPVDRLVGKSAKEACADMPDVIACVDECLQGRPVIKRVAARSYILQMKSLPIFAIWLPMNSTSAWLSPNP